jgi:hypothetical protein
MMEMRIILGTLIQNVDVNVLDGFQPDFLPELSLNPGLRGIADEGSLPRRGPSPVRKKAKKTGSWRHCWIFTALTLDAARR